MSNEVLILDPRLRALLPFLDKRIDLPDSVICMFELPMGHSFMHTNVFMFDRSGKLEWMIQDISLPSPARSYTGIGIEASGVLSAYNFAGVSVKVDIKTGKIEESKDRPW